MKVTVKDTEEEWYNSYDCTQGAAYRRKNSPSEYVWIHTSSKSMVCLNTGTEFSHVDCREFLFTPVKVELVVGDSK